MYICYIDEAGCPGRLPSSTSAVQPILTLTGLFLPQRHLINFTREFLNTKAQFNPTVVRSMASNMDIAKYEIKGADLRRDIRSGNRNIRRRTFGFLDRSLDLLEKYEAQLVARIYIKEPGGSFDGKAVYTSSVQQICKCFQHFIQSKNTSGMVVADSRTPVLNSIVSHSIFTQKFKLSGDSYPNMLEMPVFGGIPTFTLKSAK